MYLPSTNHRIRKNLDFICDHSDTNKNDYHFLLHVVLKLFLSFNINNSFNSIEIWSDGGPHHFKTRYCQWMWSWLSTNRFNKKKISHHFFASHHGHSLADSHAAAIKRVLHTQYNTSKLQRLQPTAAAIYWGPGNAQDFGALLQYATESQIFLFPYIDRDPLLKPKIFPLNQIKKQHSFVYENGICRSYERTNEGDGHPFKFTMIEACIR